MKDEEENSVNKAIFWTGCVSVVVVLCLAAVWITYIVVKG